MPETTDDTRLVTILLGIIGAIVVLPLFFMGFGMMGLGPMMGGMWGSGMSGNGTLSGWMLAVGIAVQLLFLAVIAGGGYLIYRSVAGDESGLDEALEELRVAYARGELTDDQYEQRREALERDAE